MTTAHAPAAAPVLLARDRCAVRVRLDRVLRPDHAPRGAVVRADGVWFARAEPSAGGPAVLRGGVDEASTVVEVWGPAQTDAQERERLLAAGRAWIGLDDDMESAAQVLTSTPALRRLVDVVGEVRLSTMPRVCEALGRSIIEQLVQGKEARRSIAQLVACAGRRVSEALWHWPTPAVLGATPVWTLRRCGISARMAQALHAGAVQERRLEGARADRQALDRRLRALPGVGAWTSAETRLRLGDPDAVSVGDYHLPTVVGYALAGPDGDGPDGGWTDAGMLELLAPYSGQRGRVIRLVELAAARGLVARRGRRGARKPLSAHRYW